MKDNFEGSSWITHCEYDYESKVMIIHLKGNTNVYECVNVPSEIYEAFKEAPSKGGYFNTNIKGKYQQEIKVKLQE